VSKLYGDNKLFQAQTAEKPSVSGSSYGEFLHVEGGVTNLNLAGLNTLHYAQSQISMTHRT
jgi:hypothetical protein